MSDVTVWSVWEGEYEPSLVGLFATADEAARYVSTLLKYETAWSEWAHREAVRKHPDLKDYKWHPPGPFSVEPVGVHARAENHSQWQQITTEFPAAEPATELVDDGDK